MNETTVTHDVYALVTDRIIAQLEQNIVPWQRPWSKGGLPQNLISKIPYRGINVWMLSSSDFAQNFFLTWKQAKEIGASIKKGEKATMVVFWKKQEQETQEEEQIPSTKPAILRYYWVYNIVQCDNIPKEIIPTQPIANNPIEACEEIITTMPLCPALQFKEAKAYYDPQQDFINMPPLNSFLSSDAYYSTFFHEIIHSTGHEKRLNRKELNQMAEFGSEPYSKEELVAEIGSCYLSSYAGISQTFDNSVAYINGWLSKLKHDKRFVIYASSYAQRAVDYVLHASGVPE
jgi:antirestriction protein ArdC